MHEFLNNLTENWNVHNVSNSFNTYFPNTIFYLKPSLEVRTVKNFHQKQVGSLYTCSQNCLSPINNHLDSVAIKLRHF